MKNGGLSQCGECLRILRSAGLIEQGLNNKCRETVQTQVWTTVRARTESSLISRTQTRVLQAIRLDVKVRTALITAILKIMYPVREHGQCWQIVTLLLQVAWFSVCYNQCVGGKS